MYGQSFSTLSGKLQLSGYDVVVCLNCGFSYADNIPSQAWFDIYYRDMSKYTYDQREGQLAPADVARFKHVAELITTQAPDRSIRILDFGCATGGLLSHLKEARYENLIGFEKTPGATTLAKELYSLRVVNTPIAELVADEGCFDLVIQSGVLEHIRDVRGHLSEIAGILKPDGLMYVEVPDVVAFEPHMVNPFQEFSIEHINFFSTHSLNNLMASFGFEPVKVIRITRDYTQITKMGVICGFYRNSGSNGLTITNDEETRPALQRYIDQSLLEEKQVKRIIDDLVARKIPLLVWGVGTYTLHLVENSSFSKLNIVAFADSNKNYHGQTLLGKAILSPSELKAYSEPILISTYAFQTEIETQIRHDLKLDNDIITLKK